LPKKRKRVGKGTYIPIYESDTRKIGVAVGALVNSKKSQ
jgi:hypothetical protein